jgi:polysaccharide export outer membrane protein
MKKLKLLLIIGFLTLIGCASYDTIQSGIDQSLDNNVENRLEAINGTYRLCPPDSLQIVVTDNPDLTTGARIRPDGNIFFPLLGDVYVEGLNPLEIREKIHKLLGRYLKELPEESVSVTVTGFRSKKVYIYDYGLGIREIPFTGNLTVLDAITQSGLLSRTSNQRGVKIIRGESDTVEKPERLSLNLKEIIKEGKTANNIILRPNDIVYISPTLLGRVGFMIKDLLNPIQPARQLGSLAASYQYNQLGFGGIQSGSSGGGGSSVGSR